MNWKTISKALAAGLASAGAALAALASTAGWDWRTAVGTVGTGFFVGFLTYFAPANQPPDRTMTPGPKP